MRIMRTIPVFILLALEISTPQLWIGSYPRSLLCIRVPAPKSASTQSGISTLPTDS